MAVRALICCGGERQTSVVSNGVVEHENRQCIECEKNGNSKMCGNMKYLTESDRGCCRKWCQERISEWCM